MANVVYPSFPVPSSTNVFQCIWKLTRVMKAAGWSVVAHSNGSAKTSSGTNNNDSWGSNANPLLDTYPSFDASVAWIVMRGPSTLKIPISGPPTGMPLRGEKIVQDSSLAEGELIGYVWDSGSTSGWAVVSPRTGTFDNTNTIIGASSAATLSPTGTIVTYVREFVFAKTSAADNLNGMIYYICADQSSESSQLFSTLAASAGCTASVQPGGGGTGNSFPTLGIICRGVQGSTTNANNYWVSGWSSGYTGNSNMGCANATPATGVSADGSFYITVSNTSQSGGTAGFAFMRLDDTEPGDVDPYVWFGSANQNYNNWNRTNSVTTFGSVQQTWSSNNILNTTYSYWVGYQARGCPVTARDVALPFIGSISCNPPNTSSFAMVNAYPATTRTLNHPSATPPLTRESVLIYGPGTVVLSGSGTTAALKQYKGRCRWLYATSSGSVFDTYDNKLYLCVVSTTGIGTPAFMVGPWDGSSTPSS